MAISLRTATVASSSGTGSASQAVNAPTGLAADDLCLIIGGVSAGTALTAPSGFTASPVLTNGGGTVESFLFYRKCDGTEGASFTVAVSGAKNWAVMCIAATGVALNTPFDPDLIAGIAHTTGSTNCQSNGLTTLGPNDLLIWYGVSDITAGGTPPDITVPAGYAALNASTVKSTNSNSTTNMCVQAGSLAQATAGVIAGPTGTLSLSRISNGRLLALATDLDHVGTVS